MSRAPLLAVPLLVLATAPAFAQDAAAPGAVPSGTVPFGTVPSGTVPAGTVPAGTVPAGTVPSGTVPSGTVPESALTGPTFSLQPGQTAPPGSPSAPEARSPNRNVLGNSGVQARPAPQPTAPQPSAGAPGAPAALLPKRPASAAAAPGDPLVHAYHRSLQEQLPAHGYRPGPPTGELDGATERAIRAYQRDAGIPPDARSPYALQQTIDSVNFAQPPIQAGGGRSGAGSAGGAGGTIAYVQERLAAKGYDPGPADGKLGQRTVTAIKDFESDRGLAPEGKVSPQLLDLLGRT